MINCNRCYHSTVGRLHSNLGVQAQFISYMVNCAATKDRRCFMIEISYEALFALAAFCAGAGYVLGKDIHKKK